MTNPKKQNKSNKTKIEISRRQTSGKKKPDLFAKFRNDEHPLDGIVPEIRTDPTLPYPSIDYPSIEQDTLDHPTETGNMDLDNQPEQFSPLSVQTAVSPNKNFTKVSNSVIRQAIPDGLFRGQSKHTYDVLYQATRGAINPKREVQLKKSDLVRLTGLEMKTIQRHLSFLRSVGLIIVDPKIGDHKGALYQVKIPEESTPPYPTLPESSMVESMTKRVPNPSINSTTVGLGKTDESKGVSESSKTSYKTNTDDDEGFAILNDKLSEAVEKLTGKKPSKNEAEKWGSLADLLILELEAAASRTEGISSVPAFLTEVLRRQFFASKQNQAHSPKTASKTDSKSKTDTVGKAALPIAETYEIKPLDEQGREAALTQLEEFATEDFLADFEKWYTAEDWEWLKEKLKSEQSSKLLTR